MLNSVNLFELIGAVTCYYFVTLNIKHSSASVNLRIIGLLLDCIFLCPAYCVQLCVH